MIETARDKAPGLTRDCEATICLVAALPGLGSFQTPSMSLFPDECHQDSMITGTFASITTPPLTNPSLSA